ncbi:MAG: hypothetical protein ACYC2X_01020 [Coriobacteriia bacterium]
MDERYYILGGVALLLLALIVYLFDSIARYRRAVRNARRAVVASDAEGEAKYLSDGDGARVTLSSAVTDSDSEQLEPVAGEPTAGERIAGLYDSLLAASEALPTEPSSSAIGTEQRSHVVERDADELLLEEPSHPLPVAGLPAPGPEGDELALLMSRLEEMTDSEPPPPTTIAVAPEPALPEPEPEPEPELPELAPVRSPGPGYSLADELERLMDAAESQSAFLPPEAHAQSSAPSPEPLPMYEAPPLLPPLSVGQALSSSDERPVAAPAAPPAPESAHLYALVAPVELHFTGGGGRVGVKPGTRSYAEFQRLAGIMLSDLRAARGR